MTRATIDPTASSSAVAARRRRALGAVALVGALVLGACGGGDDDDDADTSSTTTSPTATPTTVRPTSTTAAPATTTPTTIAYVTEGASVIVANASRVDGAAGRMTDRLASAGFTMGTAGNSTEGPLEVTKIYYDPANEAAQDVADSLRLAFGGGDITVSELTTPPPLDVGEMGDASVLIAMGNDIADRTLEDLQGVTPPADDTGDDTGTDTDTADDTGTDTDTADDT